MITFVENLTAMEVVDITSNKLVLNEDFRPAPKSFTRSKGSYLMIQLAVSDHSYLYGTVSTTTNNIVCFEAWRRIIKKPSEAKFGGRAEVTKLPQRDELPSDKKFGITAWEGMLDKMLMYFYNMRDGNNIGGLSWDTPPGDTKRSVNNADYENEEFLSLKSKLLKLINESEYGLQPQ